MDRRSERHEERLKTAARLRESGATYDQIADEMGIKKSVAYRLLQEIFFEKAQIFLKNPDNVNIIKEMQSNGLPCTEIAKETNQDVGTISTASKIILAQGKQNLEHNSLTQWMFFFTKEWDCERKKVKQAITVTIHKKVIRDVSGCRFYEEITRGGKFD